MPKVSEYLDGKLEPAAVAICQEHGMVPVGSPAEISIAISLKRIADTLAPADGTDITSLIYYLTQAVEQRS